MNKTPASGIAAWWGQPFNRVAVVLLTLYAIALSLRMEASGGGPDPSGYLNNAKLLGRGMVRVDPPAIPGLDAKKLNPQMFVPVGFRLAQGGQMIPIYPAGLPLAVLAVAQVTGWDAAPHVTMLAMVVLGVLATAWLGMETGLPREWAWFGSLLLAASPLYILMSLQLMSDVPALVSTTCAVTLAWKSRKREGWAFLAGIALAYSVFVRPTDALALVPAGVCLGVAWRRWLWFGLGGLPGAVIWCLSNHASSGHFLETGYGNVGARFSWGMMPGTWLYYAPWLPVLFTPVAVCAIGLPWLFRRASGPAPMLVAWIFAFLAFYSADGDTHENWMSLRYLLPAFPAVLAGALLVIRRWLRTAAAMRISAAVAAKSGGRGPVLLVTAVMIYCVVCILRLHPDRMAKFQAIYPAAVKWAGANIPGNAVVLGGGMSGTFYCYTSLTMVRPEYVNPEQWSAVVNACAARHRPVYAAIFYPFDLPPLDREQIQRKDWPSNVGDFLEKQFPGRWKQEGMAYPVTFWQLEMPDAVAAKP